MKRSRGLSRRAFLERVGGIAILVVADAARAQRSQPAHLYPEDFNAYLAIGRDGRVTVFSGKVEMGQGVLTSQAQMVAEELGVDLSAIDMVLGDTERCPWDMGTFGSLTTRMFGPALRAAAAQARQTLMSLAARRLGVPVLRLRAEHGAVAVEGEPSRRVGYGELSRGARIAAMLDPNAVLRAAADFTVMGRSAARLDGPEKVTGAARYTADLRLPGMLYARILRPPVHGALLLGLDLAPAQALPGTRVLRDGKMAAVLHADPEMAAAALARMRPRWRLPVVDPAPVDHETVFDALLREPLDGKATLERGDIDAARAAHAGTSLALSYRKGYVAHAALETHAALADVRDGRATVWASTQTPFPTRDRVARHLGLAPAAVRVITPFLGGGFGGKSADGQALEAARLSQLAGAPVQVARSRDEEFFLDTFDPAAVVSVASGVDRDGRLAWWDAIVVGSGERGTDMLYDIPHARIRVVGTGLYGGSDAAASKQPLDIGPWRAPGANMNVFAFESQVDAMAAAAGIDPVAFRLRHLRDARMRGVVETGAAAFSWSPFSNRGGRGAGMACALDAGTCVATFAEVSVDLSSGQVRVLRLVCAQDMGTVVNPEGARMQMEGALTMGLGYALTEEVRFSGSDILDRNFDRYRIPRFSDLPRIEAVLVRNEPLAPQGGGEPAIVCTGAAIANAVFDACGARMTRLPLTAERVRQATLATGR